jgi:hypothetical protein
MDGVSCVRIGHVIEEESFRLAGINGLRAEAPLFVLKEAWQKPLRW